MYKRIGLAGVIAFGAVHTAHADVLFNYPNFSDPTGLTLVGNTAVVNGSVLRIVPSAGNQAGAAYSTSPVTLGANDTFSSTFTFQFSNGGGVDPADGITFVIAASPSGLGGNGEGLGYQGSSAASVAIEYDTYFNGPSNSEGTNGASPPNNNDFDAASNPSSNHVAIDTGGNLTNTNLTDVYGVSSCNAVGGYPAGTGYNVPGCMSNGDLWTSTVSYDGANLTVTLSDPAEGTTFTALNAVPLNIASLIGSNTAYVGITGGTGAGNQNEDILSLSLSNTAITTPVNPVHEPTSIAVIATGLAGLALLRRKRAS
jgi:hypothetical protein